MTDAGWAQGMGMLQGSGMPGWPAEGSSESTLRAGVYRQHLDDLSDAAWLHAVTEAIRRERWFPTVAALRKYAAGYVPRQDPSRGLPVPVDLDELEGKLEADREARRIAARNGLELVRAAFEARALSLPAEPVKSMPKPVPEDEEANARWKARQDLLRAQAAEIAK